MHKFTGFLNINSDQFRFQLQPFLINSNQLRSVPATSLINSDTSKTRTDIEIGIDASLVGLDILTYFFSFLDNGQ